MAEAVQKRGACQGSSLKGKVVLITGASSGIGAGTAVHFAGLGAKLAISDLDVENLNETAKRCYEASKETPLQIPGDLTDEAVQEKAVQDTVAHYGQLDVLVNCAGILSLGSIETASLQDFDKVMNINVRSVFHLTQLAVPHIIKTKGNIVSVSSVAGQRSFPGVLAYCMSKSAIDQFTRCVALELASKQVRVNAVCPGVIVTNIHLHGGYSEEQYAKYLEHCKEIHPLGRTGTVEEVAQAIAFLASDAASFITGATLSVDGGRHATCAR